MIFNFFLKKNITILLRTKVLFLLLKIKITIRFNINILSEKCYRILKFNIIYNIGTNNFNNKCQLVSINCITNNCKSATVVFSTLNLVIY